MGENKGENKGENIDKNAFTSSARKKRIQYFSKIFRK